MLLEKEHSLVADSTGSSSPPQSCSNTLMYIHRPARTYGRRRDDGASNGLDAPSSSLLLSSASRDSIHNTAPPGLSEEIPPSSPPDCEIPTKADEEVSPLPSLKFEFSWRKELRQLDEDGDLDASISNDASKQILPETTTAIAPASIDVFGVSHSSVDTRPPLHKVSAEVFRLSSPQVNTRTRRMFKVIYDSDSDSDSEPSKGSPSTTPASALHLLHTPNSGSSSTQPTSDDDMPAKVYPKLPSRRRLAPSSRVSVTPLTFTEAPNNEISEETRKKKTKIKAPTKKDLVDTIKERGRLAAQSAAVIPRNEKKTKFTVGNLLAKVQDGVFKSHSVFGDRIPASDPIEAFSSPNNVKCGTSEHIVAPPSIPCHLAALSNRDQESPDQNDSDDSDLPEISNMFKQNVDDSRKKQALKEAKERALARLQWPPVMNGGDDDDLEIVAFPSARAAVKEEDIQRRSENKLRISEGRKRQMQFGKVSLTMQEKERTFTLSPGRGSLVKLVDQTMLNQFIAVEARKEAQRVTRKKEEEWRKHGGQVSTIAIGQRVGLVNVVKSIAEKGLKAAEARKIADADGSQDEEGSDKDWEPELRGSASPQILPANADSEPDENIPLNEDITMIDDFGAMEDDANIRARTARRRIVDSESEDENENENARPGVLATPREESYRRSTSLCELPTEDEYDKENNVSLMYDRSEDKENNAVVRHSTSVFDIRGDSPSLPYFTQSDLHNEKEPLDEEPKSDRRRPLGELLSEESPLASPIGHTNLTQSFAAKLQQASPLSDTLMSFSAREGLQPAFDGFSQFSEGEPDIFRPAPLLQPGFADLFESATEKQTSHRELDDKLSGDRHSGIEDLGRLRCADTLNLTQDVALAFKAENRLIRKADAIFEKEQAFVLEAATRKVHNSKPELYINELGFLTQTRPGVRSPEVYRSPSPTQSLLSVSRQQSFLSPFPTRTPLRTLSFTSQLDSPERELPRRLKRYSSPSRSRGPYETESPKPRKRNAFEVLAGGREAPTKDPRERRRLDLSEFLADEAAESDDDDKFGFTKAISKDDEDDGEDMDKTLDVLMDDRDMDEDAVAADLVHEKFKEQEDEQDKEIEKLHLAAIQGELRLKRNRGVGFDDSDEESDNEENERARRAMKRLRTTDRGDIKDLEANADTRAFADTYNQSLKDDDQEFAYLEKESQLETPAADVGYKSHDDDDGDGNEPQEYISPDEMRRLVCKRAKEEVDEYGMDTTDVSWLDLKEEEQPRVKTLNIFKRHMVRSQNVEQPEVDESLGPAFRKSAPSVTDLNKRFVQENKSRNTGTSRSVGGSAVTGHTKNKPKTGASSKGSLVARPGASSGSTLVINRQVKPAESMLSVIADKRHHFA